MGKNKQRLSASVDADIKQQLDDEKNINTSAVINELLRQYLVQGDAAEAGLQRRLKEKERELERKNLELAKVESDIERLNREIDDIQQQIQERRQDGYEEVDFLVDAIEAGEFPRSNLEPENAAIRTKAQQAAMTPERFIEHVEAELDSIDG